GRGQRVGDPQRTVGRDQPDLGAGAADVDPDRTARGRGRGRGGVSGQRGGHDARWTARVRCRGESGSRPSVSARRTAHRCAPTSWANGSSPGACQVAPVASTWADSPSGAGPNTETTRPGSAIAI